MAGTRDALHRRVEVAARRRAGDYVHLTIAHAELSRAVRPGHVLMLTRSGDTGLPVALFVHRVALNDVTGGALEVVVLPEGPRRERLAGIEVGDEVLVTGPVGRPFPVPREPVPIVLVGHDWWAAPMAWFAEILTERCAPVEMLLTAGRVEGLVGLTDVRRRLGQVSLATLDGSTGARSGPGEALPDLLRRSRAELVYVAAPARHTASCLEVCRGAGIACQVVAPVVWPCGTGICGACAVPLADEHLVLEPMRACTRGPAFDASRLHPSYVAELGR